MLSYFKRVFSLDYRSLAALRIFVGLTIFLDLIQRAHSLTAHYTDNGVLSRTDLFRLWNESAFWSVYYINGTSFFVSALFIIAGIFALMMLLGYRTRLATVVSFFLLISLHTRNPLVLQGGDVALRVVLFFMMFLPLGKRFSLDNILGREESPKESEHFSLYSFAYVVQFLIIWIFTGFLKTGGPWVTSHTAVSLALSLDSFTTNIGNWLRTFPHMLRYITVATLLIERYVFALFFIPFKRDWGRLIGIILCTALLIGFNASFRLGLFGMIMFSISLGLLPGMFWDKIIRPLHLFLSKKSRMGMTIFYDGDCGFCSRMAHTVRVILFLHPDTVILMSSADAKANTLMHSAHSWVVRDYAGRSYTGFRALVSLMQSAFLYRIVAPIFLFKPIIYIGDIAYQMVAHNRPMTCAVPVLEKNKDLGSKIFSKYGSVFVFTILMFVISWNVLTIPKYSGKHKPVIIEKTLLALRLDQKWNMFAPYPSTEDGFYVIPGVLRDGSEVNVYTGSTDISYEKPNMPAWTYQDQRWQKYMMNIWLKDFSKYRLPYGQYLCRNWNKENAYDKNLMTFKIIYMLEVTDVDSLKEKPAESVTIWDHKCFE